MTDADAERVATEASVVAQWADGVKTGHPEAFTVLLGALMRESHIPKQDQSTLAELPHAGGTDENPPTNSGSST